jgi:Ca2+/Na+ antiporter
MEQYSRFSQSPPSRAFSTGRIIIASVLVVGLLAAAGFLAVSYVSDDSDGDNEDVILGTEASAVIETEVVGLIADPGPAEASRNQEVTETLGRLSDVVTKSPEGDDVVSGDVTIELPGDTDLDLGDADLEVIVDEAGKVIGVEEGFAVVDLPLSGALAGAFMDSLLPARVGMGTGAELAHLKAHLIDDHDYLYFEFGSQPFDLHLDLAEQFNGAGNLAQRISMGTDTGSTVFVVDMNGDYFYLSVPCDSMVGRSAPKKKRPSEKRTDWTPMNEAEIPGLSVDLTNFSPGCGLGWSTGGTIPFTPMMEERMSEIPQDFTSHIVIDGSVPVHPLFTVDGESFIRFDNDGMRTWSNAELDAGLAYGSGVVDVSIPAAVGTVGFLAISPVTTENDGAVEVRLAVTATAGTNLTTAVPQQVLEELLPVSGELDLDGVLHYKGPGLTEDSFVELNGDITMSHSNAVHELTEPESDDFYQATGRIRVDGTGIVATAQASNSPFPHVDLNGTATLDIGIPFDALDNSFLEYQGSARLGETDLGADTRIRLDNQGLLVTGEIELEEYGNVEVLGRLAADELTLHGETEVVVPIGDLDQLADRVLQDMTNEEQIAALDRAIDRRVDELSVSHPERETELRTTIRGFRLAYAEVRKANENIRINNSKIADVDRRVSAEKARHAKLSALEKIPDLVVHTPKLAALEAERATYVTANSANAAFRDSANALLASTAQATIAAVGWDDELNDLLTMQAEAYWGTLTTAIIDTLLRGVDSVLDAFAIDGSLVGTVNITVGTEALAGASQLEWCRDGECSLATGVDVSFTPVFDVCGTVLGIRSCL